jgi:hypothetical protein
LVDARLARSELVRRERLTPELGDARLCTRKQERTAGAGDGSPGAPELHKQWLRCPIRSGLLFARIARALRWLALTPEYEVRERPKEVHKRHASPDRFAPVDLSTRAPPQVSKRRDEKAHLKHRRADDCCPLPSREIVPALFRTSACHRALLTCTRKSTHLENDRPQLRGRLRQDCRASPARRQRRQEHGGLRRPQLPVPREQRPR